MKIHSTIKEKGKLLGINEGNLILPNITQLLTYFGKVDSVIKSCSDVFPNSTKSADLDLKAT